MTTRQEALASGLRYYNGKPCKQGHTLRYTKNHICVQCAKDSTKTYFKEHREQVKEYMKTYLSTEEGRENQRRAYRNWYSKNRDKVCAAQRERYYRNKEKDNVKVV